MHGLWLAWMWFLHFTGSDNENSTNYGFWSGFGSDLGEAAIFGGLIALYRKHNCHLHRCWRIGRHPLEGTPYVLCRHHHPQVPRRVTAEHLENGTAECGSAGRSPGARSPLT
jgi:hypothetical protein